MSDVGHLDFLQKAADLGDYVIVGLHSDSVSMNLSYSCYPLTDKVGGYGDQPGLAKAIFANFLLLEFNIQNCLIAGIPFL